MAMIHSDKEIAYYFYKRELEMTYEFSKMLEYNNLKKDDLNERVHIIIGLIDNLCHEIVYHKHKELNYDKKALTSLMLNDEILLNPTEDEIKKSVQ